MKRIQCTGCGQIFWTDLKVDENLVGSGEWVQNPCPKCGGLWAVVEPEGGVAKGKRGRKPKAGLKRQGRPRKPGQATREGAPVKEEEGEQELSPKGIRKLRKKLGISQTKLGSLVGVSVATVVSWEKGKFSPRKDKVAKLSDLAKKGKQEVEKLIPKEQAKEPGKLEEGKVPRRRKKRDISRMKGRKPRIGKRIRKFLSQKAKAVKPVKRVEKAAANPVMVGKDLKEGKKE